MRPVSRGFKLVSTQHKDEKRWRLSLGTPLATLGIMPRNCFAALSLWFSETCAFIMYRDGDGINGTRGYWKA